MAQSDIQLYLFDLADFTIRMAPQDGEVADEEVLVVTTISVGDGFIATIENWWIGHGKTRKEAARNAAEAYDKEMSFLRNGHAP